MKRSGFKPRLKAMKRIGKKGKSRIKAMKDARGLLTHCQYCGIVFAADEGKEAHHKTPRSELRKLGVKDLDAPHRLLILHHECHVLIHNAGMGRPKDELAALEFRFVETSDANAENGKVVRGVL